jgi:hypothetical protein
MLGVERDAGLFECGDALQRLGSCMTAKYILDPK